MDRWFSRRPSSVFGLWMPGVSMKTIWLPGPFQTPWIWLRVVWGRSETIETFVPTSWLSRVDFPTFGRPTRVAMPEWNAHVAGGGLRPAPTPWE